MSFALLALLAAVGGSFHPTVARAAAILIPDHTSRLGSCGGPEGPACTWQCGAGKSCSADGTCALHGTQGFGAVLSVKVDDAPCGGGDGSVMTLGLTSTQGAGTPFQLTQTVLDLCDRNIACTGRATRACGTCTEANDCFSDGGDGDYPCPPGPVVFFCSDPCGGGEPLLGEENFADLGAWLGETLQPLPELLRAQLPSPPAVGRPVIYHADFPVLTSADPPAARACVRVAYTSQDRPLAVCSDDTTRFCTSDADCKKGTCESATPPGVNPTQPDTVASTSACAGPGADAGRPCAVDADCDSGTCAPLPVAPFGICSVSGAPCDPETCPLGGDTCNAAVCPEPACGDGILDPGEACDAGPFGPGNGCDAGCNVEPCFTCEGSLGEGSSCFQHFGGEPCDLDGRPCTFDTCSPFGTCEPGVAPVACAPALSPKAQVQLKRDPDDPAKAKFKWKWTGVSPFDVAVLGYPTTVDDVSVCAYDQTGLVFEATAPAGGVCAGKACWTLTSTKAGYKDKEATPDGLTKAQAKSGDAGRGKIQAQGKGATLTVPPLPLVPPVDVLLTRGNGPFCWGATFTAPTKNDPVQFKAKN
jgi:cysteine-rich repeat protein